ncbi:C40 family peptidase [Paenibacillus caui]|uniref:C40 family peptidase n=1 Tax=Paenibacillus caui TaxID=2873927 RepID=UPI003080449E
MKKRIAFLLVSAALFMSPLGINATHAASDVPAQSDASASTVRENIIAMGKKYLGTPYEFGSSRRDTTTFDCSDFVKQAYLEGAGITLPANSRTQGAHVKENGTYSTNWKDLKPGDIMFFMSYRGSKESNYVGIDKNTARITHTGIYLGNGEILHTYSKESGGVRIDKIEGTHWEKRFLFGGSTLK